MGLDALIVMGGGVYPDGRLPDIAKDRVEKALELQDEVEAIIMTGAYSYLLDNPPAKTEARAGADYALSKGAEPDKIIVEEDSFDTIFNLYNVHEKILKCKPWKRIGIITGDFHIQRTMATADILFGEEYELEAIPVRTRDDFDQAELRRRNRQEKAFSLAYRAAKPLVSKIAERERIFKKVVGYLHPAYNENSPFPIRQLVSYAKRHPQGTMFL